MLPVVSANAKNVLLGLERRKNLEIFIYKDVFSGSPVLSQLAKLCQLFGRGCHDVSKGMMGESSQSGHLALVTEVSSTTFP